jgi:PAS domain S-box-containing protein
MNVGLEELSKEELIERLKTMQVPPEAPRGAEETERLLHDLQVHQIELEMQNRELRESQQMLEESRAWYTELFDLAPIGYCTLDTSGRIQEANLTASGLFRIERVKLVGRSFASLVSAGYEQTWHDHLQTCLKQRVRVTDEIAFSVRDRGPVVMQVVSALSLGPDGVMAGYRTTISDISAVKQSEGMLRFLAEASETLASSLEYAQTLGAVVRLAVPLLADVCCVDVLDEHDQLRRLEAAFADDAKQALADQVKACVPDKNGTTSQAEVLRSGRSILLSGSGQTDAALSDAENACGAKSLMFVPLTTRGRTFGALTFMMAESDRRYGAKELAVAEDIAHRAAMAIDNAHLYRTARAAIESRDEVLAIVSHDLRSPLSAIVMAAQTMVASASKTGGDSAMLRNIERAAHRMHRMVGDLVDVSSIDAGRLSLYKTAHDLPEMIGESLQSFAEQAAQHEVSLRAEILNTPLRASCDRDRVLQVLSNLIGNAIKFVPPHGSVSVRAEISAGEARVSVVDTGPGIPTARLPRLFERYYQAQETASLGRGLGLYISRRLVEAQGGTIWAESTPGAGASFIFTLPLAPASESSETAATPVVEASDDETPKLILVVDDDADFREPMSALLRAHGYRVVQAASGIEAIRYLSSTRPAPGLMLVDMHMPAMNGPDLIAELRRGATPPAMPIVLMSGSSDAKLEHYAQTLGLTTYLRKPIQAARLLEVIRRVQSQGPQATS